MQFRNYRQGVFAKTFLSSTVATGAGTVPPRPCRRRTPRAMHPMPRPRATPTPSHLLSLFPRSPLTCFAPVFPLSPYAPPWPTSSSSSPLGSHRLERPRPNRAPPLAVPRRPCPPRTRNRRGVARTVAVALVFLRSGWSSAAKPPPPSTAPVPAASSHLF